MPSLSIKTAISIGKSTFDRVDTLARRMRVPRSRIFALAVEEFLERHDNQALKSALDRAHAGSPTPAEEKYRQSMRRKHRKLVQGKW